MKRLRNDRGQAGIALIIVIAWALSAVLVLTRTLVAAQEINSKVKVITADLSSSKHDTGYVAQLNQTEQTADNILADAAPLTGQLATVQSTAADIDKQVDGITPPVQSINSLVHTIQGQVASIYGVVNSGPKSIAQVLDTIRATQSSVILTDVNNIKSDTGGSIIPNVIGIEGDFCSFTASGSVGGIPLITTGAPACQQPSNPLEPLH
jgi:tetrahydromethanopterin S-methyltransferase subunit B